LKLVPPRQRLSREGLHRVEAVVAGEEVFFESQLPLVASVEAFGTLFLLPAMAQSLVLDIQAPYCPTWASHIAQAQDLTAAWWSLSPLA